MGGVTRRAMWAWVAAYEVAVLDVILWVAR